jgi:HEAT repeat protein
LNVSWSLRPATRIRPVTDGDRMLDHAIELTVRSTLSPLYPHAPGDEHSAVAGRWFQYAQADVKSFDERLLAELADAFSETLTLLFMDADLQDMPPVQVLRLLSSERAHQKRAAVEAVKKRRLVLAVPALIQMLESDESHSLRMTVAGVLAHLGDPAAIEPMAEFALLVAPEQTVYLCSEIARIGGENARRFLYWVSASHRQPEVRKAASNLLRSMLKDQPLH